MNMMVSDLEGYAADEEQDDDLTLVTVGMNPHKILSLRRSSLRRIM